MIRLALSLSIGIVFFLNLTAQTISQLADMPEPVTNQAVAYAEVDGSGYVYSFSGLDETKLYSGIHKKAFKYDIQNNSWEQIASLPTGNGRIAAGASTIDGKIYIIGGYEVFEDDSEVSVDLVHVYDTKTDTYLPDATPIPVPIDDHVQAVWRDSLIYVVTGWSNTTNVPDVQIFNPTLNEWLMGTPVPNNNTYKVFGSSGSIVGDTIYYAGGAKISGGAFGFSNVLRKGVINPKDPTQITWTHKTSFDAVGYRMGAAVWNETVPIWIGGSKDAYNYDGISYSNGVGVEPYERILEFEPNTENLIETDVDLQIMDIREVAQVGPNQIIICGGMGTGQQVSQATYSLDISYVNTDDLGMDSRPTIYPIPASERIFIELVPDCTYEVYDNLGHVVLHGIYQESGIAISSLNKGVYSIALIQDEGQIIQTNFFIRY